MNRASIVAIVAAHLFLGGLLPGVSAQDIPVKYQLIIDCPQLRVGGAVDINDVRCPVRAEDGQDAMGSPSVAVDPRNPNYLVMASLHGGDGDGPSERSRDGQVFTTFTSQNHGASWGDNPFSGPREMQDAFGEHPQITLDPYGRVYVGSLYAKPTGGGSYDWVIAAQKFKNLQQVDSQQSASDGSFNVQFLDTVGANNQITQYWFLFDPKTENMTILWHERPHASLGGAAQKKALPGLADPLAPRQDAQAEPFAGGMIVSAVTTSAPKSRYLYTPDEYLIGPCSASTNPVISEGYVYVGCVADPANGGFRWNPGTKPGTVELFRFLPDDQKPQYLGSSPIVGGSPKLGVRSDGRLAVFSTQPSPEGRTLLVGAFGHYRDGKIDWSPLYEYGKKIRPLSLERKIIETAIQDMEYRENSGAVHLILKERVQATAALSLDSPTAGSAQPTFVKTLVAIDERYGLLAKIDLDIGNMANRTVDPTLLANPDGLYNDLSDDIVQLPPRPYTYNEQDLGERYQREFLAVGDYGFVIFAEIIEITDIQAPGVPPAAAPAVPLAAPAAVLNASTVVLWTGGLALSGLFAAAMLANRRKNPLAAFTKGEEK